MISLDTNIVVRFLVNDDKKQAAAVKKIFSEAEKNGETFLITAPVLLELIYVLNSVYKYSRTEIIQALNALTMMPVLEFEKYQAVQNLVSQAPEVKIELEDMFIGLTSLESGCTTTLTFDKKAAKSDLFELLRT